VDIKSYIQSGVIESYVLGLADQDEILELERLRAQYPEINQAITEFEELLEQTAAEQAVHVPAGVKEQLFERLKEEGMRSEPVTTTVTNTPPVTAAPVRRMRWAPMLAAASLILLVVSGALNIHYYNRYHDVRAENADLIAQRTTLFADNKTYQTRMIEMQEDMDMMADSAMLKVSLAGVKGKEKNAATVFWDTRTRDVYVLSSRLAPAPTGKQYQLWALVDGVPVDAGMIGDCSSICKLKNIPGAQAFAITLENAGGSPTPTLDQMYVFGKVG
jgi:anti-sigma-K factor RskA